MNADNYVNPGPMQPDVLVLQQKHRSQKVWDNELRENEALLRVRRQDHILWQHLRNNPLHPRILNLFNYIGFRGILEVGHIICDSAVVTALIERWRPETHTFHMRTGEATITMQDMEIMFGMVVDGTPVLLPGNRMLDLPTRQNLIFELTGWFPPVTAFQGFRIYSTELVNYILNSDEINDYSTDVEVQQKFRLYLCWILGGLLLPDKSGAKITTDFFIEMRDIEAMSRQAWGAATLSFLYVSLCRASLGDTTDISGFIPLLQVWAWERILPLQPEALPLEEPTPLACKWSRRRSHQNEARNILPIIRDVLDNLQPSQFIWQPYSEVVLNMLPGWCVRGRHVWMSKVPLIFGIYREWHMIDRVVRQFGFVQHIPHNVTYSVDHYKIDKRKSITQQISQMLTYTENIWNNRLEHVVHPNNAANQDEYNFWYIQHTRILIANSGNVQHGYQPTGGRNEALAMGHEKIYRSSQILANDNTESSRTRNFAREVAGYARESMNAAYLSARLNFEQQYTPPNEYQPVPPVYRTTSHSTGDIHNQQSSSGFSGNEFDDNTTLSLQTPTTPYYPIFDYGGASTSVPNYNPQQGSGFETPNVPILGFDLSSGIGNIDFPQNIQQRQFQNSPLNYGTLNFSMDMSQSEDYIDEQDEEENENQSSQQYDINNPRRTTRPHLPTMCGTGTHKQRPRRGR